MLDLVIQSTHEKINKGTVSDVSCGNDLCRNEVFNISVDLHSIMTLNESQRHEESSNPLGSNEKDHTLDQGQRPERHWKHPSIVHQN